MSRRQENTRTKGKTNTTKKNRRRRQNTQFVICYVFGKIDTIQIPLCGAVNRTFVTAVKTHIVDVGGLDTRPAGYDNRPFEILTKLQVGLVKGNGWDFKISRALSSNQMSQSARMLP